MNAYRIGFGLAWGEGASSEGPAAFSADHFRMAGDLARLLRKHRLDGNVTPGVGTTGRWGTEPSLTVETSGFWSEVSEFIREALERFNQEAAYVVESKVFGLHDYPLELEATRVWTEEVRRS